MNSLQHWGIIKKIPSLMIVLAFVGAVILYILQSVKWGHDHWGMTEWLINYSGGFVRRGLPGELIQLASSGLRIPANFIIIALSSLLYFYLTYIFVTHSKGITPPYFVFSPVLLGSAAYGGYFIRKDVLVLLIFIACLSIISKKWHKGLSFGALNGLASVAVLSHESFFFFAIPALVMLNANMLVSKGNWKLELVAMWRSALFFLPVFITFALVVVFKGDTEIARSINESWLELWLAINPNACCIDKPSAAIDSIQWDSWKALSLSLSVLNDFSLGIYVPVAWLGTIYVCFLFMVTYLAPLKPCIYIKEQQNCLDQERDKVTLILSLQLIFISPLFILGWDFGRWIFLWTTSSFAVYLFAENNLQLSIFHPLMNATKRLYPRKYWCRYLNGWTLLLFGVPGCCWTVSSYIGATPLGFYLKKIVKFALHFGN